MSSRPQRRRRGPRILLYAGAVLAGATGAELTLPHAHSAARVQPQEPAPREVGAARPPEETPAPDEPVAQPLASIAEQPDTPLEPVGIDGEGATDETLPEFIEPPDPLGQSLRNGFIITGATPHRLILFTFDDGPDVRTTPLLLDRLDDVGVKAVFFLTANRLRGGTPIQRRQIALAREIVERGHMVGNHTVDHVQLPLLDDDAANAELRESEAIFEQVFGSRPWLFRPPFGAHSERIDFYLAAHEYTTVLWNLGAGDFQVHTAEQVYDLWKRIFERRERENGERGGIVLLHDTYPWSVDAFQMIYAHLMDRNCELLAGGEELFDIVDDPRWFYSPRGDARPSTEAPAAEPPAALLEARQARLREITEQRCRSLAAL